MVMMDGDWFYMPHYPACTLHPHWMAWVDGMRGYNFRKEEVREV